MKCLIAVIGPTAIGKTKLALHLAQDFNGEIINADSRQVYRFMDIGTAKPNSADRAVVPHHLIDIVNPDEPFSLAVYKNLASDAIKDIQLRGRIPFLVGGSGLYIWSVLEGWMIPEIPPNLEFRKRLENLAIEKGANTLFDELREIDPVAAAKIMPSNLRRIIRALEIYQTTGYPPSNLWQKKPPTFPTIIIGLTTARKALYNIIDSRVDGMIANGLIEEVKDLIARGYSLDLPSMSGIGYRQIGMFLQGKSSLPEAIQRIKYETHQFTRRQYAWFHLDDDRIHWFDVCDTIQEAINNLTELFLSNLDKGKNVN
jgi:tRNA dimethylallyltransferase